MIKKKSDGKAEKGMGIEKKMSGGMMSDGAAEKGMGIEKKMGGGMIDPTMANYQKGGSVMARGNRIARIRPTKLY
jgi:hypothetical protein